MKKREKKYNLRDPKSRKKLLQRIYNYRWFYLMYLPVLVFGCIFCYLPMIGIRYAFTNYNGIKAASWVGLANFEKMFGMSNFWKATINTLEISIFKLFLTTFAAVIVSILMNEIVNIYFKKAVQTVIYLPHFMSWVVTASVFSLILAPTNQGMVNQILVKVGILKDTEMIYFLGNKKWWRFSYYLINLWKETGWQTVIFMATLTGIDPGLYEAASIDGADRWHKMLHITFPALRNTILTVLILNLAKVMNLFESAFVLQNDAVLETANVLETYIYYQTFNSGGIPNYGYTTAVGLFKSLIGMVLVLVCNNLSKRIREGRGIV